MTTVKTVYICMLTLNQDCGVKRM